MISTLKNILFFFVFVTKDVELINNLFLKNIIFTKIRHFLQTSECIKSYAQFLSTKKYWPLFFCSQSFTDWSLLIRGRKLLGSRRKVISIFFRNKFIPSTKFVGGFAQVLTPGWPSKTITRSAMYVAMMKSCSTIKAVFLALRTNRLM